MHVNQDLIGQHDLNDVARSSSNSEGVGWVENGQNNDFPFPTPNPKYNARI
jgi:hypothetical protein